VDDSSFQYRSAIPGSDIPGLLTTLLNPLNSTVREKGKGFGERVRVVLENEVGKGVGWGRGDGEDRGRISIREGMGGGGICEYRKELVVELGVRVRQGFSWGWGLSWGWGGWNRWVDPE